MRNLYNFTHFFAMLRFYTHWKQIEDLPFADNYTMQTKNNKKKAF